MIRKSTLVGGFVVLALAAGSLGAFVAFGGNAEEQDGGAESSMPVPGAGDVPDTLVLDDGEAADLGMPVPGAGGVGEMEVDGVSAGMVVPGFDGEVQDTVVRFEN